jgi:hypothetical protein
VPPLNEDNMREGFSQRHGIESPVWWRQAKTDVVLSNIILEHKALTQNEHRVAGQQLQAPAYIYIYIYTYIYSIELYIELYI